MYCRVIACDYDGTGATDGRLAPEVAAALHRARAAGVTTLLVTGRVLEDLRVALVDFSAFDAVVAENGALVWLPERDQTFQLGPTPPESFLGRLHAAGIPFGMGAVVISTWEGHANEALRLIREAGLDLQLVFNRGALMLLPSGVDKATGVRRALDELCRSEHGMVAFGDAENDLPLFAIAERSVAARGTRPAIAAQADEILTRPGAEGIAHFVESMLDAGCRIATPARHHVILGTCGEDPPVTLPLGDGNVLVSGDPRTGKSWLVGLISEQLIDAGYRVCVIDPEGDHGNLAERPRCASIGRRLPLPEAADLPVVLENVEHSLVVSLTRLAQEEKNSYVCTALDALARERERTGLPTWIVVDEAHYFFREGHDCCSDVLTRTGNMILSTYRPSLLPAAAHDSIVSYVLRRTDVDSERYFAESLLGARGPRGLPTVELLGELGGERAGLLTTGEGGPRWRTFVPATRLCSHVHHGRKYVEGGVAPAQAFRFLTPAGGVAATARTVREFVDALRRVPVGSLRHHLVNGDFSRWSRDVLGDPDLADGLAKLEHTAALGASPSREEIVEHVLDRYVL